MPLDPTIYQGIMPIYPPPLPTMSTVDIIFKTTGIAGLVFYFRDSFLPYCIPGVGKNSNLQKGA